MSLNPLNAIADFVRYQSDKRHVIQTYERFFSRKFHWNHPTRFTEKMNKFKISKAAEDLGPYVDKYEVRSYFEKQGVAKYLIPLIGVYNTVDEIPFDSLPNTFVLKTTHGSGWNIICRDKKKFDIADAKTKLKLWMSQNYYEMFGWERQYKKLKPRIVCEEYIDLERSDMVECKFFCMDGKPFFITAIKDRLKNTKRVNLSLDWKQLPFATDPEHIPFNFPKPKNLQHMIDLAMKLSAPFHHVRVDFYVIGDKFYIGELTFSTCGGMIKFTPDEWDITFGTLWG